MSASRLRDDAWLLLLWAAQRSPRGANGGGPAGHLDRRLAYEPLAIELEYLDLSFDHALNHDGAFVVAPGNTLAPGADARLCDRREMRAGEPQDLSLIH